MQYSGIPSHSLLCIPHYDDIVKHHQFKFYITLANQTMISLSDAGVSLIDYAALIQRNYGISLGQAITPYQQWSNWQTAHARFKKQGIEFLLMLMGSNVADNAGEFGSFELSKDVVDVVNLRIGDIPLTDTSDRMRRSSMESEQDISFYCADSADIAKFMGGMNNMWMTVSIIGKDGKPTHHNVRSRESEPDWLLLLDSVTEATDFAYIAVTYCGYAGGSHRRSHNFSADPASHHTITCICFVPGGMDQSTSHLPLPVPTYCLPADSYQDIHSVHDILDNVLDREYPDFIVAGDAVHHLTDTWRSQYEKSGILVAYGHGKGSMDSFGSNGVNARKLHLVVDQIDHVSKRPAWTGVDFFPPKFSKNEGDPGAGDSGPRF